MAVSNSEQVEVNIVGPNTFGRYNKISAEATWNMFISDNWLINYAGFKQKTQIFPVGEGRGLFNSVRGNFLIVVVSNSVYKIDASFTPVLLGKINTLSGDVYIDENLNSQICIVDGKNAYIYNYLPGPPTFTQQTLVYPGGLGYDPFSIIPGYVAYHNTFFLIASAPDSPNPQLWFAFTMTAMDPTSISVVSTNAFLLQTKPDSALIVERLPGRGNNVLVMGSTVGEVWTQVGGTENYRRVQSFNIDYGVVSVSSLASSDEQICWLSQNENNSPVIMYTNGSETKIISNDGIDHLMDQIKFPAQSTAFFFRQDGHIFYQITFYNPVDNISLIYDFSTGMFFYVSDENLNYHPARKVAFFDENTYFVSINDGSLYNINTNFVTYDYSRDPSSLGSEIPRIRICKTIRRKNSDRFRVGEFTFTLEQGMPNLDSPIVPRIDMSFSKNGNQSFSNVVSQEMNATGNYRNIVHFWRMGQANEFTIQLRFYGFTRMVIANGIAEIY